MDPLKEAFERVKQDLFSLNSQIEETKNISIENRKRLIELCEIISINTNQNKSIVETVESIEKRFTHYDSILEDLVTTLSLIARKTEKIGKGASSTQREGKPTVPTEITTEKTPFRPGKGQITPISIGNGGVPTDRQTNRQTNRQTHKGSHNQEIEPNDIFKGPPKIPKNSVDNAMEILNSLDDLKKEIRLKFKRLTEQEILVFSTIYQLEEEQGPTDYKTIANRLKLTESSIRDYVGRLIKKGIPVEKLKINNKSINLSISPNLKKIVSLSTILQLRDI